MKLYIVKELRRVSIDVAVSVQSGARQAGLQRLRPQPRWVPHQVGAAQDLQEHDGRPDRGCLRQVSDCQHLGQLFLLVSPALSALRRQVRQEQGRQVGLRRIQGPDGVQEEAGRQVRRDFVKKPSCFTAQETKEEHLRNCRQVSFYQECY